MIIGSAAALAELLAGSPLMITNPGSLTGAPVPWASRHAWLGCSWQADLEWEQQTRIAKGSGPSAQLLGLLDGGLVSLPMALILFQSKVGGIVAFGSWQWGIFPASQVIPDKAHDSWARVLLGGDYWRNAAVARGERGWLWSG